MPFIGLGLHILVALFFAVHAMRNRKQMYWMVILFSFPILGSVVYFFAEYLPSTRLEHQIATAGTAFVRSLDPGRELREARTAFEVAETTDNQMRLAHALLEAGHAEEASHHFSVCLTGPFGAEPEVRIGAARTELTRRNVAEAANLLASVRRDTPKYRPDDVLVLLAQSYWAAGMITKAASCFAEASSEHGSVETRAEHAMFALATGDIDTARRLQREIDIAVKTWNSYNRKLHRDILSRLDAEWVKSGHSKR
jgi:hypothetical protein